MSAISDDQLFRHADRVHDRVVIITGAASGIGKETALRFAAHGAKVVIGDLDVVGAEKVVKQIEQDGGKAIYRKCNVTVWEEQVELFELAMSIYGSVDVVIPNAGMGQSVPLSKVTLKNEQLIKPSLATLDVNLNGVVYAIYLAQHYLTLNRKSGHLKAVVLIGSMASWLGLEKAELYAASKHAILGLMRSLAVPFASQDIRISCIHPFFADTAILPLITKVILAGIPLATVPRIAGAIFYSATNPDPETSGNAWLIPDNGPVFRVPKEEFKLGVYKMIDDRRNAGLKIATGVAYYGTVIKDLTRVLGKSLLGILLAIVAGALCWHNKHLFIPAN